MFPLNSHLLELYTRETISDLLAEAEQTRLTRQIPRQPSLVRVRLAALCRTLADRLDDRPPALAQASG